MLLPDCVSYIIFVFLAMWHGARLLNRLSRVLFEQNWRPLYSNYIEKIEIKHMLSNFYASFILRYRMNFQILQRTEIAKLDFLSDRCFFLWVCPPRFLLRGLQLAAACLGVCPPESLFLGVRIPKACKNVLAPGFQLHFLCCFGILSVDCQAENVAWGHDQAKE